MNEDKFVGKTADTAHWPLATRDLWLRIAAHSFEDPDQELSFTVRLARDHGWSLEHARGAIEEYRRFCFLAVLSPAQVTPSEDVDEVWHQHLAYSRDYWDSWCGVALGRQLHHQPTKGGAREGTRFAEQYAETLARYETWFGPPDPLFWPGTAERFGRGPRFRIVDRDRAVVLPLPNLLARLARRFVRGFAAAGLAAATLAPEPAAAGLGILDWEGDAFLRLYAVLATAAVLASTAHHVALRVLASRRAGGPRAFTPVELALIAHSRARAIDVMALELMQAGQIRIDDGKIEVLPRPARAGPSLADILRRHGTVFTRARLAELLEPSLRGAWERLAGAGWSLSPDEHASIRRVTVVLVGSVALFGLAKLAVGLSRGKPVGPQVLMMVVMLQAGVLGGLARSMGSLAGLGQVRDYRGANARALRAPRREEVLAAFAVVGAVALVGTPLAAYANVLPKADGGCGGGGDGGGSGCGGCS